MKVNGSGEYVGNVYVHYFDADEDNSSAGQYELSWYEGGASRSETHGSDSGRGLVSSKCDSDEISMTVLFAVECWHTDVHPATPACRSRHR